MNSPSVPTSRMVRPLMVHLLMASALVFSSGCSSATLDSLIAQLSPQADPAVAPKTTRRRTASKAPAASSLPHGSGCVCPTIVTGTSHGCWEAL